MIDLLRALGWLGPGQYIVSPRAKPLSLAAWHDPDYLAALQRAEAEGQVSDAVRQRFNLGTHSNPVYAQMFRRPATAAGGSILAGKLLQDGGVVYSPGGGTHHGMPDRANGFCYLNDPVLALLSLRANGLRRLAYVDIDAHHPDGVEHAFRDDGDILMVSVHEENRWPRTGRLGDEGTGQVFNLPVPRGFNDTEMRHALDGLILPRLAAFAPEAIVLQCGADALAEDPLSRLELSNGALWRVVAAVMPMAPRLLVLGGGGYNPWSVARAWAGVWAVLNGWRPPVDLPQSARAVLQAVRWSGRAAGRNPPPHWSSTLADPPRPGALRAEVGDRLNRLAAR